MRWYTLSSLIAVALFVVVAPTLRAADAEAAKGHVAQSDKDKEIVAKQGPAYPLKTCPVTGAKLGDMGAAVDYIYKDRLVKFCWKGCITKFEAKADEYLAQLDKAAKEPAGAKGDTGAVQQAPASHAGHGGGGGCCK
jgi:hypothetical protein